MNQILSWLSGGDLRSDGMSDQAADLILEHPELVGELVLGLQSSNDVIRGRTADALEKVARINPDLLLEYLTQLIQIASSDPVPMVKMHLAMLLGHLVACDDRVNQIEAALLHLLGDSSAFTRSWAIVGLCIIAVQYPSKKESVFEIITRHQTDPSKAIRTRVRKALVLLGTAEPRFPKGWVKSQRLRDL